MSERFKKTERTRCENCVFFDFLECKRNAPVFTDRPGNYAFPNTPYDGWCGEFQDKEESDA